MGWFNHQLVVGRLNGESLRGEVLVLGTVHTLTVPPRITKIKQQAICQVCWLTLGVQSPPQQSIWVPLPFSEGAWIPRDYLIPNDNCTNTTSHPLKLPIACHAKTDHVCFSTIFRYVFFTANKSCVPFQSRIHGTGETLHLHEWLIFNRINVGKYTIHPWILFWIWGWHPTQFVWGFFHKPLFQKPYLKNPYFLGYCLSFFFFRGSDFKVATFLSSWRSLPGTWILQLMVQKFQTTIWDCHKTRPVNNGDKLPFPQLVCFFSDFWLPSTVYGF